MKISGKLQHGCHDLSVSILNVSTVLSMFCLAWGRQSNALVIRHLKCCNISNTSIFTYPHKKTSRGLMSGDRGGQAAGPPLQIQHSRNLSLRNAQTWSPQSGGAPSNWKIICRPLVLNMGYAEVSSIFRKFAWHVVFSSKKNGHTAYLFIRTMFQCLKRSQRWFAEIAMFTRSVIAYELVNRF